jgi:tetratricopeptide (TPR) repeat protein
MKEGMENLSNCAHSKQERNAYLEHAWSEYRIAVNLNSADTLNRASFVALSEVLKRKPEFNGGIAKEPDKAELAQLLADHPELVSKKDPDSLESLESLEDSQLNAEHNKALADAKEGVRLKPTDGYAWYALGEAYLNLGDYTSAEEPFKRALEAFLAAPPDPWKPLRAQPSLIMAANASLALAQVCDKLHRKREAERYRREALMLLPTH